MKTKCNFRPAAARTIKCDQCKKEFPANVDESVLVHHIKTAHMTKAQEVGFESLSHDILLLYLSISLSFCTKIALAIF